MEEEVNKLKTWPHMTFYSLSKSFFIKLATVGIIWGVGFLNWNFAWLVPPIAFVVLKSERKRDGDLKRLTAQATALSKEKIIIESRIDELPTWVYFPDYDRAEWLNGILYKLWPSVNHYVRDLFKNNIQYTISECIAEYQKKIPGMGQEFRFGRLVLGRIPPKINGIKVYDKHTSRNEVVLDMDVMYAGDCDITFTMGTLKAGIKDFQLRGMLRVVLKPLIPIIPIVGGVQAFFLNCPIIDFNLVGVADVLDLPGFSDVLRKIITEQIAAIAVLPNKFSMPLSEDVPAQVLKTPEPEGILRIHVVQAKHLMKKDFSMLGKGKSDPYAIITVGAQEFKTKTIDNTVDPKWDFWCECIMEAGSGPCKKVMVHLFDKDTTGPDDLLGRATIEVSRVKKKGTIDTWISLELAKHGMIHLRLTWLQLSANHNDLAAALKETQELRVTSMSTALLIVYVDSAKNLPCLKGSKQPDVYLELSVGGKVERTKTLLRSCNPVWEQGFTLLVINPETGTLHIKLHDEKTATVIGTLTYNLSSILAMNNLEVKSQPFDLQKSGSESKVLLSMILKILKYEEPEITSEDEEEDDIQNLNKKLNRQESTISSIITDSPLKRQPSKESIQSAVGNVIPAKTTISANESVEEVSQRDYAPVSGVPLFSPTQNNSPGLIRRNPSVTSSSGDSKLGRIQLTMKYSISRQKLMINVHKIANLPLPSNDPSNIPDPYVKLYLLPDRHKDTKRRTAVIKDNCNPTFDEQFEYIVSQGDINTRILELSVCTQKGWLSTGSNCIGQTLINLSELDFTQTITSWYDLQPEMKT
ncbi:PREDICTED: extended synaptotagmin-1 isoform X2 [Ceratosolen solmsi marchali]|uniref:Extended synaptotagmin-1 isoform X2 n=1 Tax=Ceratosolen solmsi marchali TaxID=326594 RepID=A0AAJ6YRH6_9HYME|nr:PREDICTED: extended synaptotagmin-1 isoform X2 [Ceratosolen solmsi marchali]